MFLLRFFKAGMNCRQNFFVALIFSWREPLSVFTLNLIFSWRNCRQKVFVALIFSWRELSVKVFYCSFFQLAGTVGKKFLLR
jgi:hypothetical protein